MHMSKRIEIVCKLIILTACTCMVTLAVALMIALTQFQVRLNEARSQSPHFSLSDVIQMANVARNIENNLEGLLKYNASG